MYDISEVYKVLNITEVKGRKLNLLVKYCQFEREIPQDVLH